MQRLDPKVIALFFVKKFLGSVYVLPLWFIGVSLFEKVWTSNLEIVAKDVVILLLEGAGIIFIALLILICYVWSLLIYKHFSYELALDGLHIYSGVVVRRHVIIQYADLEDVQLLVNPIAARFLDLYAIQIKLRDLENTKGLFRKKQLYIIPGLSQETARSLRPELIRYTHVQKVKKTYFDPATGNYR